MRIARASALLVGMALVLLTACSAPSVSLTPFAPTDTQVVVSFTTAGTGGLVSGGLEALDVTSGQLLWKTPLGNNIISSHPTIENGVVYAIADEYQGNLSHVVAVRASDGKLLWRVPSPGPCLFGSILVDESAIAWRCGRVLYVLDPTTGAERWHSANPVERCVMGQGVIYALADLMGDASDLLPQSPGTPPPTVNFTQHAVGKALVALNERNGSLLWQVRHDVGGEPVAVTDRTLYLSGLIPSGSAPPGSFLDDRETYAFDAHSGRRLTASSHTATGTVGSTIYAMGQFLAATDQVVLVYDFQTDPLHPRTWALSASDGKVLWDVPGAVLGAGGGSGIIRISGDFMYIDGVTTPGAGYRGVTAVRVRDGSVAWTWGTPTSPYCTITGLRVIGGSVFVTVAPPCYSTLTSLNAATGALNWQHTLADARYIAVPASDVMTTQDAGAP